MSRTACSFVFLSDTEEVVREDGTVLLLPPGQYIAAPIDGRDMPPEMDAQEITDPTLRVWCDNLGRPRAVAGGVAFTTSDDLPSHNELTDLTADTGERFIGLIDDDALLELAAYVVDDLKVSGGRLKAAYVWVELPSTDRCYMKVERAYALRNGTPAAPDNAEDAR